MALHRDPGAPLWPFLRTPLQPWGPLRPLLRPWGPWLLLLWSAALTSASSSDHISLHATPGSSVLLCCEAPEGTDLENLVLEWSRSDLKQSFVFMFRDGRPLQDSQHPHFRDRVELKDPTLRSGDLSITLSNIGQSDSGVYSCHVFSHSHVKKRSVLGTKPITAFNLTVGPDHTLQVFSRTTVMLQCEAPHGTNLENVAVEWTRSTLNQQYVFLFRDGRPLQDFQHPQFRGRVELVDPTLRFGNLSILLHDVSLYDSGLYTCHVSSHSHVAKRSVLGTPAIKAIKLQVTVPEPQTIHAIPGQDVILPAAKPRFNVTSLMWKREDHPEQFVFQSGSSNQYNQHPQYSGRTWLQNQDLDLSMILHRVQPSDNGTYHAHIVQSQQRVKRNLHDSEPYSVVILKVQSSGAVEAGGGVLVVLLVLALLKILE